LCFYSKKAFVSLIGYTNSDWEEDAIDTIYTIGYVFKLSLGSIYWSSKNLSTLYIYSCEAEYMEAKDTVWIQHVLVDLALVQNTPTKIGCNNQSVIQIACNLVYHSKTKYIDLDTHYIQDLVIDGVITLEYCPTKQQAIDIFTKSMKNVKFIHLHNLLGIVGSFHQGGRLIIMTSSSKFVSSL